MGSIKRNPEHDAPDDAEQAKSPAVSFGDALALAMESAGVSQSQLARSAGVSQASVSRWLAGRSRPSRQIGRRIARVLRTLPAALDPAYASAEDGGSTPPSMPADDSEMSPASVMSDYDKQLVDYMIDRIEERKMAEITNWLISRKDAPIYVSLRFSQFLGRRALMNSQQTATATGAA